MKKKSSDDSEEVTSEKSKAKPARNKIYKAPKTFSLKEELSAVQKTQSKTEEKPEPIAQSEEVKQEQPEQAHQQEVAQPEETVEDGKTLEQVWAQIMAKGEELGPRINQALQAANPQKISDNAIKIQITADSHKELYEKHKASVYDVLVTELGIKDLKFEWELVESELESKRPLKDAEKYQAMAEENPALKLLKDKFNLDIKK